MARGTMTRWSWPAASTAWPGRSRPPGPCAGCSSPSQLHRLRPRRPGGPVLRCHARSSGGPARPGGDLPPAGRYRRPRGARRRGGDHRIARVGQGRDRAPHRRRRDRPGARPPLLVARGPRPALDGPAPPGGPSRHPDPGQARRRRPGRARARAGGRAAPDAGRRGRPAATRPWPSSPPPSPSAATTGRGPSGGSTPPATASG